MIEKEAFKKLLKIEEKLHLWEHQYKDQLLWPIVRGECFEYLSGSVIHEKISVTRGQSTLINILKRIFFFLINAQKLYGGDVILNIFKRIFFFLINSPKLYGNNLIFLMKERQLVKTDNSNFINPYIDLILTEEKKKNYLILESPHLFSDRYKKVTYKKYIPFDLFLLLRLLFKSFLKVGHKERKKIKNKIRKIPKIDAKQKNDLYNNYIRAKGDIFSRIILYKFLRLLNPGAKIYYSPGFMDKINDQNESNINVEVQHSMIPDTNTNYIIPKNKHTKKILENKKMIVFQEQVKELLVNQGYLAKNIILKKHPLLKSFFTNLTKNDFKIKNKKIKVLIIGSAAERQHRMLNDFINQINNLGIANLKYFEIELLFHPKDVHDDYIKSTHVKYSSDNENLYKKLLMADIVVSPGSTVLHEATYFGCFNLILIGKDDSSSNSPEWPCKDYDFYKVVNFKKAGEWIVNHKKFMRTFRKTKGRILVESIANFSD